MGIAALVLLLLAVPCGVAAQNITAGVATLLLCGELYAARRDRPTLAYLCAQFMAFKTPILLLCAYVVWSIAVDLWQSPQSAGEYGRYVSGLLIWIFLPLLGTAALANKLFAVRKATRIVLCVIAIAWTFVCASQLVWGWKWVNGVPTLANHYRASGFHSHPLTLAYVAVLAFPYTLQLVFRKPRMPSAWIIFLGECFVLVASMSRTVQAAAMLMLGWQLLSSFKGKTRSALVVVVALVCVVVASTDNVVSQKFRGTISGEGIDRAESYADDRLVFWHAHWLIFKEAPLIGSGLDWNDERRTPYYEQLGLGSFKKMYSAHNQYLQTAVQSGLVGLGLFLSWFVWHWLMAARFDDHRRLVVRSTIVGFGIACLTQNAVFDAEVRFALTIGALLMWLELAEPRSTA